MHIALLFPPQQPRLSLLLLHLVLPHTLSQSSSPLHHRWHPTPFLSSTPISPPQNPTPPSQLPSLSSPAPLGFPSRLARVPPISARLLCRNFSPAIPFHQPPPRLSPSLFPLPMCSLDPTSAAFASHGRYYCHFLGRHPDDTSLPDPVCRWWPLWHRFTRAADGTLEYHNRILFYTYCSPGRYLLHCLGGRATPP